MVKDIINNVFGATLVENATVFLHNNAKHVSRITVRKMLELDLWDLGFVL